MSAVSTDIVLSRVVEPIQFQKCHSTGVEERATGVKGIVPTVDALQRMTADVELFGFRHRKRERRLTTPSSATAERGAVAVWWSEVKA